MIFKVIRIYCKALYEYATFKLAFRYNTFFENQDIRKQVFILTYVEDKLHAFRRCPNIPCISGLGLILICPESLQKVDDYTFRKIVRNKSHYGHGQSIHCFVVSLFGNSYHLEQGVILK